MIAKLDFEKVRIFGRRYALNYMIEEYNQQQAELSYKHYTSEFMRMIARSFGGKDVMSWQEVLDSMKKKPEKEISEKEAIINFKNNFSDWLGGEEP